MAATNYTPIQLYRTTTAGAAPASGNMAPGELAININDADMALYAENASGVVKRLINNPAGLKYPTADGSAGQVVSTDGAGNLSFSTAASGDVTLNGTQTLTNKTISADSNTLSGIAASSFVLSNASGNIDGAAAQKAIPSGDVVGTTDTQTMTNKTLQAPNITSGLLLSSAAGTSGQVLTSQGAGAAPVWASASGYQTGDIVFSSRNLTSPDWLPANGTTYLQSSYPALYSVVGLIAGPDAGVTWTIRTSGFSGTIINGVTFGNGLFVAVGESGVLTTSTDGVTWTSRTSGFSGTGINGVGYGNNLFVAVGNTGKLTTSPDGVTWTSRTSGFGSTNLFGVTYGNGLYVAVGGSGVLTTSPNGTTWTSRTSGISGATIYGVTFGNGLFVAVADGGFLSTSTDGITWTARTSGISGGALRGVTYGNGLYVAVGITGRLTTSPDGITWTARTSGGLGGANLLGVTYGAGLFVAVAEYGGVFTSPDGITWTSQNSNTTDTLRGVTYGNGLYVAVGVSGTMRTSTVGYNSSTQFITPYQSTASFSGAKAYIKA